MPNETSQEKLIQAKTKLKVIKEYLRDFRDIADKLPREMIGQITEAKTSKTKVMAPLGAGQ